MNLGGEMRGFVLCAIAVIVTAAVAACGGVEHASNEGTSARKGAIDTARFSDGADRRGSPSRSNEHGAGGGIGDASGEDRGGPEGDEDDHARRGTQQSARSMPSEQEPATSGQSRRGRDSALDRGGGDGDPATPGGSSAPNTPGSPSQSDPALGTKAPP